MSGLGKYFNAETYTGRANVAKATYASFALLYIVYKLRRVTKKDPSTEPPEGPEPPQPPSNGCPCEACEKHCSQYCPCQPNQSTTVAPSSKDSKLSIPEDPLFKQQQKRCECDISDYNEDNNGKAKTTKDDDDDC